MSGNIPPLLYLPRDAVTEHLPDLDDQLHLVEQLLEAHRAGRTQLPPKPGVYPRRDSVVRALPVYLEDQDVASVKWVGGYAGNRARGLNFMNGLIILSSGDTGMPLAVMDAGEITAARTAALSGLCVRNYAPPGWRRAAILGCGEQGRFHAATLRAINPDVRIRAYDPHAERIRSLGAAVEPHEDPVSAIAGAEVVITAGPIRTNPQPVVFAGDLAETFLVLPLDFDSLVAATVADAADVFLVDDVAQFGDQRAQGRFGDWRDPDGAVGEAPTRGGGSVICVNLGIGALDAAFAFAVYERACAAGAGMSLPR